MNYEVELTFSLLTRFERSHSSKNQSRLNALKNQATVKCEIETCHLHIPAYP